MIRTALRAWGLSLAALLAAGAGLSAVSASASGTTLLRLSIAAAVLSVFAALVALLTTERDDRTWWRCLIWGGAVPLAVGLATGGLAATAEGSLAAGALALAPWLAGVLAAAGLGRWLPTLGIAVPWRRREPTQLPW